MTNIFYRNRFSRCGLLLFAIILMAVYVMPDTSFADTGPLECGLKDLIQEEQDVKITIWIGKRKLSDPISIVWWYDDEREPRAGINRKFLIEDSMDNTEYCVSPDEAQCFLHPDECHDCDSNGELECMQGCSTKYFFLLYHRCAPIGEIQYGLEDSGGIINVVDSGVECDPAEGWFEVGPVTDGGVDADADAGMDHDAGMDRGNFEQDEGGSGCGVAQASAPSLFELILVFLMITAGLLVFRMKP